MVPNLGGIDLRCPGWYKKFASMSNWIHDNIESSNLSFLAVVTLTHSVLFFLVQPSSPDSCFINSFNLRLCLQPSSPDSCYINSCGVSFYLQPSKPDSCYIYHFGLSCSNSFPVHAVVILTDSVFVIDLQSCNSNNSYSNSFGLSYWFAAFHFRQFLY